MLDKLGVVIMCIYKYATQHAHKQTESAQLSHKCLCVQSVEGMKVLCFELMEASGGRASASTLADLAASANELVIELTRRVHQASFLLPCNCI